MTTSLANVSRCRLMRHLGFEDWKARVDNEVFKTFGLVTDDLCPDPPLAVWYEQNVSPVRAARKAIARVWTY